MICQGVLLVAELSRSGTTELLLGPSAIVPALVEAAWTLKVNF